MRRPTPIQILQENVSSVKLQSLTRYTNITWIGPTQTLTSKISPSDLTGTVVDRVTYLWALEHDRSSLAVSVDIIVVICPTLCSSLARPERRRDLRNMAPINYKINGFSGWRLEKKNHENRHLQLFALRYLLSYLLHKICMLKNIQWMRRVRKALAHHIMIRHLYSRVSTPRSIIYSSDLPNLKLLNHKNFQSLLGQYMIW